MTVFLSWIVSVQADAVSDSNDSSNLLLIEQRVERLREKLVKKCPNMLVANAWQVKRATDVEQLLIGVKIRVEVELYNQLLKLYEECERQASSFTATLSKPTVPGASTNTKTPLATSSVSPISTRNMLNTVSATYSSAITPGFNPQVSGRYSTSRAEPTASIVSTSQTTSIPITSSTPPTKDTLAASASAKTELTTSTASRAISSPSTQDTTKPMTYTSSIKVSLSSQSTSIKTTALDSLDNLGGLTTSTIITTKASAVTLQSHEVTSSKEHVYLPQQCTSPLTLNLTEHWRNNYKGPPLKHKDIDIVGKGQTWFRFVGQAGNQLRNKCPNWDSCGSSGTYWSDDNMPSKVGQTIDFLLYEAFSSDGRGSCKIATYHAYVTKCSAERGSFVYKMKDEMSGGKDTLCGMDI